MVQASELVSILGGWFVAIRNPVIDPGGDEIAEWTGGSTTGSGPGRTIMGTYWATGIPVVIMKAFREGLGFQAQCFSQAEATEEF